MQFSGRKERPYNSVSDIDNRFNNKSKRDDEKHDNPSSILGHQSHHQRITLLRHFFFAYVCEKSHKCATSAYATSVPPPPI
jgi:hypothetical protein